MQADCNTQIQRLAYPRAVVVTKKCSGRREKIMNFGRDPLSYNQRGVGSKVNADPPDALLLIISPPPVIHVRHRFKWDCRWFALRSLSSVALCYGHFYPVPLMDYSSISPLPSLLPSSSHPPSLSHSLLVFPLHHTNHTHSITHTRHTIHTLSSTRTLNLDTTTLESCCLPSPFIATTPSRHTSTHHYNHFWTIIKPSNRQPRWPPIPCKHTQTSRHFVTNS